MYTRGQQEPHSAAQLPVYVWQAPEGEISIHLRLDVVRHLSSLLKQQPRGGDRDPEIGGLLLGSVQPGEPILVTVNDVELVPSAHARGPSYTLTSGERAGLEKRIRQRGAGPGAPVVVGWFRTHSRPGLYLDQGDLTLMNELFAASGDVALVVAPRPEPKAGFFFWENGDIHRQAPYLAFPFDVETLISGGYRVVRRFDPQQGPVVPAADRPGAVPTARLPRVSSSLPGELSPAEPQSWLRARVWIGGAAIAALMLASGLAVRKTLQFEPGRHLAPARAGLGLRVEKSPGGLKLMWDHNSRLLEGARRAALHITDGGSRYTLDLTASQLAMGSIMYFPIAPDVAFDMVVTGPGGESREALRTFAPLPRPEAARDWLAEVPGLPPPGTPGALPALLPDEIGTAPGVRAHRHARPLPPKPFEGLAARADVPERHTLQLPPGLSVPPVVDHRAIAPFVDRLYRKASVTVRPGRPSGLLGKIPLLRRLQKQPQADAGFVSPRPLRRVAPAVPPSLEAAQDVDVRVRIDESGEVFGAEVLTKGAEEVLANAAATAARDWRFEPAQRNGHDVASEVVLRFQFAR